MNFVNLILIQLILINLVFGNEDYKPLIQEILVPRNLNENQTIKLNCELVQGYLPTTIDWYLNDKKLEDDNTRIKIKKSDDSATLMIKYLSVDDNGDYYCLAANQYGEHRRHASVYVNSK